MKLSSLRNFVTVAKYANYTKAAEYLHLSQPSLSRQIMELEKELGVTLFFREHKSLVLTEQGQLLLSEANDILERCDRLPSLFQEQQKQIGGVLSVGYQKFFNMQWMYLLINQMKLEQLENDIIMRPVALEHLRKDLEDSTFDAVFALKINVAHWDDSICVVPLKESHLRFVFPEGHPLADRKKVSFKEVQREKFILIDRKSSPAGLDYVITQCMENGYSPEASCYVSNMEEGLEQVALGRGISFIQSMMDMGDFERRYGVRFVDVDAPGATMDFIIAYKQDNQNPILQEMLKRLKK